MSGPDAATRLYHEAEACLRRQDWPGLAASCEQLLRLSPHHADGCFLAGIAALQQRRPDQALAWLQQAASLAPQRADYHAQLARARIMLHRVPEALTSAAAVLALPEADALALDTAGVVFTQANRHEQAATAFARAVALAPGQAALQYNLGAALTFSGRVAEAEQALLACVAANPQYWKAWPALVGLRPQCATDSYEARIKALLPAAQNNPEALLQLHMALFKVHEDRAEYGPAFRHLTAGKAAWRRQLPYQSSADAALFGALERLFATPLPAADPERPLARPIFIVGMPRTGTTLVERIFARHSAVSPAGELRSLPLAVRRAAGLAGAPLANEAVFEAALKADPEALAADYLAASAPLAGATPHYTDKQPVNFLYAGFIARALPEARIICLRRNAPDTCIANFRQLFARDFPFYHYSWNLADTGRYYLLFDQLLRHWQRVLPGRILELEYEALVADQAGQTRRLLEFCRLPWEEACLDFTGASEAVATASALQVREPMQRRGIGRWRLYEPWLGELRTVLESQHE